MPRPAHNALQLLTSSRWAMRRENLEMLLAIVERDDALSLLDRAPRAGRQDDIADDGDDDDKLRRVRALFTAPATAHAKSPRLAVRDGVAILPIIGPLCRYASWIQDVCGMTSYQLAAMDFRIALEDPSVRAIMLHLDTPGGEVNGCSELAELIFSARGQKPIVAMVSDAAASAGYWIAAAADSIVVTPGAYVGSLGVYFEIVDYSAADAEYGVRRFRIVSSQSPNKVPDPADDAGRAVLQREADQFADAFLEAVAKYRGCTVQDLIARGDGGAIHIGRHAVTQQLADRVATAETVLAELAGAGIPQPAAASAARSTTTTEFDMKKSQARTPSAAAPRALKEGDEVTCTVAREATFAEGEKGTVVEVRDNVVAVAIKVGETDKRWLLSDEIEGGAAPAAPAEGSDDDTVEDEPAAVTAAFPKAAAHIAQAERERITSILSIPGSASRADVVQACIADPTCTRAQAVEKMLAAKPAVGALSDSLKAFLSAEHSAAPSASSANGADAPDRADAIIAAHNLVRGKSR